MTQEDASSQTAPSPRVIPLEAVRSIQTELGLDFVEGVGLFNFWNALSYLIQDVSISALNTEPDGKRRNKIESARKALEKYVKLASELREENLFPLMPQCEFLKSSDSWFHDHLMRADNIKGKSKGRTGVERRLYIHAAALFRAAFGKEPTHWSDQGSQSGHCSELVTFVKLITELAPSQIDEEALGVKGQAGHHRLSALWQTRSADAISQGLKAALKQKQVLYSAKLKPATGKKLVTKSVFDEPTLGTELEWKVQEKFYAGLIGRKAIASAGKPRDENSPSSS